MKECLPCRRRWLTWFEFVRHMQETHKINRENLWRRANQIGDKPCVAVRSAGGRWALMVQGSFL